MYYGCLLVHMLRTVRIMHILWHNIPHIMKSKSSTPAGNYMFKVNNRNTRSGVFIVNFEHIEHLLF